MGTQSRSWRDWLGINSSTFALLGTIVLVTAATELWAPVIPEYLKALRSRALAGAGGAIDPTLLLIIGCYGLYRDGLEAVNYYVGGAIAGRFNTRRALLAFNVVPLIGLAILLAWQSTAAVFIAIPFLFAWDSIGGAATITVVGDSLPADRRTMAFSLQAIFRRVARMVAYALSGALVWGLGRVQGVRADALLAVCLVLGALVLQYRYMRTATRDATVSPGRPRHLFRRLSPDLRRLLAADIFARWAEGLAGPFIILFCVPLLAASADRGTALYQSVLLNIQAATNIVMYLAIGPLASRAGLAKKPYIGLTFVFFALFPVSLAALGPALGFWGLAAAFVVGGMREIGEPARKAMIAELVPADVRTQATGLYWSVRSVAVMWASPVGALFWIIGDYAGAGYGPILLFSVAGLTGLIGAALFWINFGRGASDAVRA